jgi:DNA-binding transcriptional regulator YiaG
MSAQKQKFSGFMKELREKVSLNIEEAARNIGVGVEVLKSWEDGKSYPSELSAQRISAVYMVPQHVWLDALKDELKGWVGPKS